MAFSYTINIYEKALTTTIYPDMLAETFKLDESLDSSVITIPRSTRKTPFKRFSRVNIVKTDGYSNSITTDWLIYSTKVDIGAKGTSNTYNHTLAMIEPTKWLEKFIIGTKTFTQPLGGTQITLDEAVDQIIALTPFLPKILQQDTRLIELDSTFRSKIEDFKLPQIFFDKKNAREIFIGLFKVVNAIPRIYYDLTEQPHWKLKGDFINQRQLKFSTDFEAIDYNSSASGDNFAQKAQMFHENTVPENFDKNTPNVFANSITEYITFRSDEIIVGEDNMKLILAHKLKEFVSLEIFSQKASPELDEDIDLTDYVYNKNVYDLLRCDILDVVEDDIYDKAKSNSVYWQYGNNSIDGFNSTFNLFDTGLPLDNILDDVEYTTSFTNDINSYTFKVTYIPLIQNMRSEQYRVDRDRYELTSDMFDNMSSIQLNPSERINDLYDLTSNLYGQIQRIGVDTVSFSRKHYNIATYDPDTNTGGIYSLGDYTEDNFFITKVEVLYYRSFAIARYEASRDWNRLAQFIQLDKEFRPYEISLTKTDFNLKRDITIPLKYVIIGTENTEEDLDTQTVALKYNFLNTFRNSSVSSFDGLPYSAASLQINRESSYNLNETAVYKPLMVVAEKNVIKFKLDFDDTKSAGKKNTVETEKWTKKIKQVLVPYTLDDGTFRYCKLHLFKNYWGELEDSNDIITANIMLSIQANAFPEITLHDDEDTRMVIALNTNPELGFPVFLEAYVYDTYADFPATPSVGNYLELATNQFYYIVSGSSTYTLIGTAWLIERTPDFSTERYEVYKDQSEILGVEMPIPILTADDSNDTLIIGDMLSRKNFLITGINEALYYQTSATRYSKSNTKNVGIDYSGRVLLSMDTSDSKINVPSDVYSYNNFSIVDSDGNLFIAVNQFGLDGIKVVVDTLDFNFIDETELFTLFKEAFIELDISLSAYATGYIQRFNNDFVLEVEGSGHLSKVFNGDVELLLAMSVSGSGHAIKTFYDDAVVDINYFINATGHILKTAHGEVDLTIGLNVLGTGHHVKSLKGDAEKVVIEYGVTAIGHKGIIAWVESTLTYWNAQDTSNRSQCINTSTWPDVDPTLDVEDYAQGFAMKVSDGALPATWAYWVAGVV